MDDIERYRIIATVGATRAAELGVYSSGSGDPTVSSVNGKTGVVLLDSIDVGAATLAQGAKADTAVQPGSLSKGSVGLDLVDNTSDLGKPISTVQRVELDLKLDKVASFSNTVTSGTNPSSSKTISVSPNANSTQVVIGERIQINYSSSRNMQTNGYLLSGQDVINTAGTGTHDKIVGRLSQHNFTGGNISSAVGFEASISTLSATTQVGGYAGYYFPNLSGVANINNVGTLACFSNDEPRAIHRSAGPYVNADLRELAPSRSAGLVAGRYYTSPCGAVTTNIITQNVIYVNYVYIPRRCTPTKLGCNVTTGSAGNVIFGLYKVRDNTLTTLVTQTASISTGTVGEKEGVINTQIDSGVYAIVAVFSGTPTIGWHAINTNDMIGSNTSSGYSEQAYIQPFAFGALPATANILPTFAANTIETHLWFRL